jgi:glycosyltransferase involved in cell wall biosynthesis
VSLDLPRSPADSGGRILRRQLAARFGVLPVMEAAHKLRSVRGTLVLRTRAMVEQRRLRSALGAPIRARVVTVIPTHARREFVHRAVGSALAQSVDDHAVIVVDDGSGALPDITHPRLTMVSLRRNLGSAGAVRNIGIGLSRSKYLAFLDDDNEWEPEHLETAITALEAGADLVYTGVRRYATDGTLIDELSVPFERALLRTRCFVDTNAIVVRRGPGVRFSWAPRRRGTVPLEDWELAHRLSRRRRVAHVAVPTVRYLYHDDSFYKDGPPTDHD